MSFLKQTLKNTASILLAVGIIGTAYAAITTVNSGDPLTADAWNEIVNKITNTDTNSTDLVTKAYVDNTVSAAGGGGYQNCESHFQSPTLSTSTLTCSAGKSIRSHSHSCTGGYYGSAYSYMRCGVTNLTTTSLSGEGRNYYGSSSQNGYSYYSASIICCDN